MRAAGAASLVLIALLVSLPWLVKLDGHSHANWEQFLGRFHPLTVHLPIGLLLLVPVLEIAGKFRPALREAAGFVLGLAFAACLFALTLGVLLAHGGGETGVVVSRHMAGAIALTIAVLLSLFARAVGAAGNFAVAYPLLLTGTLLLLVWTAHLGGSITYGSNYLTEYLPSILKKAAPQNAQASAGPSFYAQQINPILDANCVSCHGESKTSGGLRMDSYDLLMKGGKDGPVISAGSPANSLLLMRITLPATHKQFMPSGGRPPLSDENIAWIKAWIQQGASPTSGAPPGIALPQVSADPPHEPVGNYSALKTEILQLQQSQGAKLIAVSSKPEDGLVLFTSDAPATFDDAHLAQFQKFAPYIVEAELGRTAVTDASFDTLKQFTHLRALHLEQTRVTGAGLQKLAGLSQLTYLNLSGTQVTSTAIAPLNAMENLHHIYLYNTPAQPMTVTAQGTSKDAK
jgi:uncharacterized membrane protein